MTTKEAEVMQTLCKGLETAAEGLRDISKVITRTVTDIKTQSDRARDLLFEIKVNATNQ